MRLRYTLIVHAIFAIGLGLSGFCHETDDDISFLRIEFPEQGIWKASAQLDGEAIFLSLAEGWPDAATYARLQALYWDFSKTGAELRLPFLEAIAPHITFKADGQVLAYAYKCSLDPEFDYEASLGQSFRGLVEYSGKLPAGVESFIAEIPPSYNPLQYAIQVPGRDQTLTQLFRPRTGHAPRPFLFKAGNFSKLSSF